MKTILTNALNVLSPPERGRLLKLFFLDFIISLLDISFLAALLFVVGFYTNANNQKPQILHTAILRQYPLLLITIFLILFSLKNFAAYLVFNAHYKFVYNVAS